MPPKADIEVAAAAFTALLVLLLAVLLELEEPQPTVSSRLPATAAPTAIACLARKISLPNRSPLSGDQTAGSWLDKCRSWLAQTNRR
jgi:uncharacterized membrane protein YccC